MSRGLPGRAGPVTLGYGGPPGFFVAALEELRRHPGQSGAKRRLKDVQHVTVWAKLVELKAMNITPEFVASVAKADGEVPPVGDLVKYKLFGHRR